MAHLDAVPVYGVAARSWTLGEKLFDELGSAKRPRVFGCIGGGIEDIQIVYDPAHRDMVPVGVIKALVRVNVVVFEVNAV